MSEPQIIYCGQRYEQGLLEKVCIDWSSRKIRGSLKVKPENNHPNIKKQAQMASVWFSFDDIGEILFVRDCGCLPKTR